jgi:hypothetical protein
MDKPLWIVIGENDCDRGHAVFGPFASRLEAERWAEEAYATRETEDDEEDEEDPIEWEVTLLIPPEG